MSSKTKSTPTPSAAPAATAATAEPSAAAAAAEVHPQPAAGEAHGPVRKERIGVVVSNKMQKTIVVKVERRVPHPRFKKIIRLSTKFHAHDETNRAAIGDKVLIRETRPMSRTKRWELIEILAH